MSLPTVTNDLSADNTLAADESQRRIGRATEHRHLLQKGETRIQIRTGSTDTPTKRRRTAEDDNGIRTTMAGVQRTPPQNAHPPQTETISKEWMENLMKGFVVKHIDSSLEQLEVRLQSSLDTKINAMADEIAVLRDQNQKLEDRLEKMERGSRRRNIKIAELNTTKENVPKVVSEALKAVGVSEVAIKNVIEIKTRNGDTKFIATCDSTEAKAKLMANKRKLRYRSVPFFINDDLTPAEEEIQFKLRKFAESLGPRGTASVAYGKVYAGNRVFQYNGETKEICEKKVDF